MGKGGSGFGGASKIFELKGEASQKLRDKGVIHSGICTGLRGELKGKLGEGHAKFSRDN